MKVLKWYIWSEKLKCAGVSELGVIYDKDSPKYILKEYFKEDLKEFEEGTHLTIADSGVWISVNDSELSLGCGLICNYYNPDYDDINIGIERFFNLLTKRLRITNFYKGDFSYKHIVDIELKENQYEALGTAMTWLYPFWKTTTTKIRFEEKLINSLDFENRTQEIKNYAQQIRLKRSSSSI
jgi:hypothetical protein